MENHINNSRENNFNLLRLLAAFMVLAGHMSYIIGVNVPMLLSQGVHAWGVRILFCIGGYLITLSWQAEPNIGCYLVKRIFRIMPLLIAVILITTFFIGPILSTLSLKEYLLHPQTWNYLKNTIFYISYALPGVFSNNPYPNAVNGSLWSLPVEIIMYLCIPLIFSLLKKSSSKRKFCLLTAITIFFCCIQIIHLKAFSNWRFVVYGLDIAQALDLIPFYFLGVLFTSPHIQKLLNTQIACVMLLFSSCFNRGGIISNMVTFYIVLPYMVFSIALAPKPIFAKFFGQFEISYGIYLWGFLIQQIIVYEIVVKRGHSLSFINSLIFSVIVTVILGLLSSWLIEKPSQHVCRHICSKIKSNNNKCLLNRQKE